jgi:hypothetical protein
MLFYKSTKNIKKWMLIILKHMLCTKLSPVIILTLAGFIKSKKNRNKKKVLFRKLKIIQLFDQLISKKGIFSIKIRFLSVKIKN